MKRTLTVLSALAVLLTFSSPASAQSGIPVKSKTNLGTDYQGQYKVYPGKKGALRTVKAWITIKGVEKKIILNEGVELAFEPYLPRAASANW